MLQQRRSARQGPQVRPETTPQPVEDFGANSQTAVRVGPAAAEETPVLGAFGDTHEHIAVGDGDWASDLDEDEQQAVEPGFEATGDTHEHIEVGGDETVVIHGVELTLGQLNAMGDFAGSIDEIYKMSPEKLLALRDAMERKAADPEGFDDAEWSEILGDGYQDLAFDNGKHFAGLNVETWRQHHLEALGLAAEAYETGDPELEDRARATEAFGAHFLTDTFSAGHLFEKQPVMDTVTQALGFVDRAAIVGVVSNAVFDKCPDTFAEWEMFRLDRGWGPVERLAWLEVMQITDKAKPDLLPNAAVRAIHDHLGTLGVQVVNDHHEPWTLRGDHEMDDVAMEMASQACAASAEAIEAALVCGQAEPAFDEVESYVPRPTEDGQAYIADVIEHLTDPTGGMVFGLIHSVSEELNSILGGLDSSPLGVVFRPRAGDEEQQEEPEAPQECPQAEQPDQAYGPRPTYGP